MRRTLLLVVACLLLAGCAGATSGQAPEPRQPPAPGPDVSALEVTGVEPLRVDGPVRLSPDGERLLLSRRDLCVTAPDGTDETCVTDVDPDARLARWSPDGTKLVFTDNFFQFLLEPDVWVFDVVTGDLRNLTDDGVDDYDLAGPDPKAHVDVLPSWSPDGTTVWFARSGGDERTELMSVPVGGGEPARLGEIDCATVNLSAVAWSADHVAWTCGVEEPTVRLAGHDGSGAEQVLTGRPGDWTVLEFSPDGRWLLADSGNRYEDFTGPSGGAARAVPTAGGDPVPVAGGEVAFPTWSPRGHAIAYVELPGTVRVVPEPGGEPRELHGGQRVSASAPHSLSWADGKLLATVDGTPTVLTLGG